MIFVGDASVATTDQNRDLQKDALQAAGCERRFPATVSGARGERPGLTAALNACRSGATLVVWKRDRLGRSRPHLVETVRDLSAHGVGFKRLQEQLATTTAGGTLIFPIFAALAAFERPDPCAHQRRVSGSTRPWQEGGPTEGRGPEKAASGVGAQAGGEAQQPRHLRQRWDRAQHRVHVHAFGLTRCADRNGRHQSSHGSSLVGSQKGSRTDRIADLERYPRLFSALHERQAVRGPDDVAALFMVEMAHLDQEQLRVACLDTKHRVQRIVTVYQGSVNASLIRIGEVFKAALRLNSTAIIVCHNHPSGDGLRPSPEDVRVTRQIIEAGKLLDCEVLDHMVVGKGTWTSLRQQKLGFDA